ncbi:DUF6255 family natural product biosynthesis protein [Streptomyces sp. NPDC046261]|uniref:DUF6255 family natural product biosynthesis protein n=1 Tax=Streptomyces sp. NPDC046261 TaxID=3157200 RepID=UPI00340FD3C1
MRRVVGRLVAACRHLSGWSRTVDKAICKRCGVERYSSYRLLRMPIPVPTPVESSLRPRHRGLW